MEHSHGTLRTPLPTPLVQSRDMFSGTELKRGSGSSVQKCQRIWTSSETHQGPDETRPENCHLPAQSLSHPD